MDAIPLIIASLLVFIGDSTDYNIHIPWPTIEYLDGAALDEKWGPPCSALGKQDEDYVVALYDLSEEKISLIKGTDILSLQGKSRLLHELVHHVQNFNEDKAPQALADSEREAYAVENKWRKAHNLQPAYVPQFIDGGC